MVLCTAASWSCIWPPQVTLKWHLETILVQRVYVPLEMGDVYSPCYIATLRRTVSPHIEDITYEILSPTMNKASCLSVCLSVCLAFLQQPHLLITQAQLLRAGIVSKLCLAQWVVLCSGRFLHWYTCRGHVYSQQNEHDTNKICTYTTH